MGCRRLLSMIRGLQCRLTTAGICPTPPSWSDICIAMKAINYVVEYITRCRMKTTIMKLSDSSTTGASALPGNGKDHEVPIA